jgi:hypothetical protein
MSCTLAVYVTHSLIKRVVRALARSGWTSLTFRTSRVQPCSTVTHCDRRWESSGLRHWVQFRAMTATLAIAVLGVVLSVASLAWQFANFILTGPRVNVELQLGVVNNADSSTVSWLPTSGRPISVHERARGATREVVIVTARNRGRATISIASVGLVAGHTGWLNYDASNARISEGIVRLDPGHSHKWRADVWPVVDELRSLWPPGAVLQIKAVAELGTGRNVYSPRRAAWVVPPSLTTVLPGGPAVRTRRVRPGSPLMVSATRRPRSWLRRLRR